MEETENSDTTPPNRELKDGVLRYLLSDPENAAEVYNAVTGDSCIPDEVDILTMLVVRQQVI